MPLSGWTYFRTLTDSTGGSLAGAVCRLALTSATFDFSLAKSDGSDLRVYDETAAAVLPCWLMDYDSVAQTGTLFYKSTLTSHVHSLCYGNPAAPAVSSFAGVFTHGTGFDADWGDLTTSVAAAGTATRLPKSAGKSDPRERRVWKRGNAPAIAANAGGGVSVREFSIVCDQYGTIQPDGSGNWIGYHSSRETDGGVLDTYRAQSADQAATWTNHTQALAHGSSGAADELGAYVGSVVKFGPTDYRMWYDARAASGATSIRLATSTDNVNWTKGSTDVIPANTSAITDVAATSVSLPWVRRLRNAPNAGTWIMLIEGEPASGIWQPYLFTSPDAVTWTIANGGASIFPFGGTSFFTTATANPKLLEIPDGSGYALEFNGSSFPGGTSTTAADWQVGWAKSSTLTSGYAIEPGMPALGRAQTTYGLETSGLVFDSSGNWVHHHQDYTGNSSTAAIWRSWPIPDQGGLLVTTAAADTALAGVVLDAGTFTVEAKHWITAHRYIAATNPIVLGLWDNATVPTGDTFANLNPKRRLEVWRQGPDPTAPGIVRIAYWDATNTRFFWTGTGWATPSTNSFPSDLSRPIAARISDDGTNFVATVTYADDGSAIAGPATIAKSSVHSFASGRVLIGGDPFNDNWAIGHLYRYIAVRPYVATEPVLSLGSLGTPTATLSGPSTGTQGNQTGPFVATLSYAAGVDVVVTPAGTLSGDTFQATLGGGNVSTVTITAGSLTGSSYLTPGTIGTDSVSITTAPIFSYAGTPISVAVSSAGSFSPDAAASYVLSESSGHVLLEDGVAGLLLQTPAAAVTLQYCVLESGGHVLLEDGTSSLALDAPGFVGFGGAYPDPFGSTVTFLSADPFASTVKFEGN